MKGVFCLVKLSVDKAFQINYRNGKPFDPIPNSPYAISLRHG
jgi:hypothetical protein